MQRRPSWVAECPCESPKLGILKATTTTWPFSSLFIVHGLRNMAEKRTRNWATIIYPRTKEGEETTCPEDWADILAGMALKCAVSPLHDKDVTSDGEVKKAHRHVVVAFDGVKTAKQAKEVFDKIGGVGCEPIQSLYAMTRYLTHLDNPEKAQYSSLDVLTFGGYEYKRYANTKEDEEKDTISKMGEIFNICAERIMYDFAECAEYLMCERQDLFSTFRKNPYFFATFFKSKEKIAQILLTERNKECIIEHDCCDSLHNLHHGTTATEQE